jgi:trimeric autotransporter adhesin
MKQNYFLTMCATAMLLVLALSTRAVAQYSFTALNTAVTENFNGMGSAAVPQGIAPSGPDQEEFAITALPNWRAYRRVGSGSASQALFFSPSDGTQNSGGVYNYGVAGNSNRMLGSIGSGSTTPTFGTSFTNNITTPRSQVNTITVSFLGAQWRTGGRSDVLESLEFQYRVGGTDLTPASGGGWTTVPGLAFSELNPTNGTTMMGGSNGSINGSLAANQTTISGSITGLTLNVGQTIWFRWNDTEDTGNDNGFAIDDLVVTPTATTSNESDIAASGVAGVSVYANPTSGRFNVDFSLVRAEKVNISLVDLTGATRQVLQSEQALEAGSYSRTVDTDVAPGLYFVAVETSRGRKLTKLVVTE